jgi:hypothetical protein
MKRGTINNVHKMKRSTEFKTVGELINYLEILGRDRYIMLDNDGNTYPLDSNHIGLWDENLENSPVAFFTSREE